jgi:iron complex outermembrane receptor protein
MNGVRWKENIKISNNLKLTAGLDRDSMSGKSTTLTSGSSTSMPTFTITSPYASVVHTAPLNSEWTLQSSATLRNYQHNYYDSSTSPAVGLSLIGSSVTYYMNLSQGMNYPGLDGPVLKAAGALNSDSWQNLKAEKNNHSEVGAKIKATSKTEFDFSYFSDRVNNRYYISSMTMYSTGAFSNKGAEATLRHQFSNDWTAFFGGTFLNPSIYNLPYAPKQAYTFGLNGKTGPFKISLDAQINLISTI